ncbi:MAG: PepSY domain-containing protein [Motiliproteus sp.]|nr:PepSY domain-containing protein [Motiliproteus sp.]MCW9052219.1 PepSY domain-containing protein [Motiliproteus sp.]
MLISNWFRYSLMIVLVPIWTLANAESLGVDQVRMLVEAGEILSLEEILTHNPSISDARLLDLELERDDSGKLVYEFELLNSNNLVIELEIDAATGALLHEEFEE